MRFLLAAILVCAVAAPPAYAASSKSGAKSVSASKSETGKRARQSSASKGLGGIHPLVGSGDY